MVRFIMISFAKPRAAMRKFTFHYGQIYYFPLPAVEYFHRKIYIPIWLDLLSVAAAVAEAVAEAEAGDLHSTMGRFIIMDTEYDFYVQLLFTFHYGQIYYKIYFYEYLQKKIIYIPLWLDLLSEIF